MAGTGDGTMFESVFLNMRNREAGRNVYHHLPEPARYFSRLRRFLKPGGRVAVVEHKPEGEEEAHAGDGAA